MPDKQDRYRQRKTSQGFQRVEVVVPVEVAGHLKAYARALRDAHQLGLELPLFDGMRPATPHPDAPTLTSSQSVTAENQPPGHAPAEEKQDQSHDPTAAQKPSGHKGAATKPDFSNGLFHRDDR